MKTILLGVGGSHAYGIATADSDIDRYGIYVLPTKTILGIHEYQETIVTKSPDSTLHEVGKFLKLAMACNPTVLDLLYLNDYETKSLEADLILLSRDAFLSQRIKHSYGGYALDQARRLITRNDGTFSSDHRKRYAKHAHHCFRLLRQGRQLLETGTMTLKVEDPEELFAIGELEPEKLMDRFEAEFKAFDAVPTHLPERCNMEKVNEILITIRGLNND